jgi:hypothetical protein
MLIRNVKVRIGVEHPVIGTQGLIAMPTRVGSDAPL